jgi:hypothetical protein
MWYAGKQNGSDGSASWNRGAVSLDTARGIIGSRGRSTYSTSYSVPHYGVLTRLNLDVVGNQQHPAGLVRPRMAGAATASPTRTRAQYEVDRLQNGISRPRADVVGAFPAWTLAARSAPSALFFFPLTLCDRVLWVFPARPDDSARGIGP